MSATNVNPGGLRIIKTARTQESINNAARQGFRPLLKPVVPSPRIKSKYSVLQDTLTGEITVINDFRSGIIKADASRLTTVIGFKFYYPHQFESPFAAYLIPPDIEAGEKVFLEDLIEDIVACKSNQGDTFRLQACEATWDGNDMVLHFEEKPDAVMIYA